MAISVALIGCAHIHVPQFVRMLKARPDISVKSVWDHDAARGQMRADELGARYFADYRTILSDGEIKAVIICTETNRHREIVLDAARAGKDMFVEKPLAFAAADANAMADAITKAGVKFQTGYFMRGAPSAQFIKQKITEGAFGKITRVFGSNCHAGAPSGWFDTEWRWMADPAQAGGGGFADLGTHSLDLLLWLTGDVSAVTAQIDNGTARFPGCDQLGEGLLRFANGAVGSLAAGWDDLSNPLSLLVSGTTAHAAVINHELFFTCKDIEGADGKTPWTKLPTALPHAFELFLEALAGKDVPLVTVKEAAYRNVVMEAMYTAAKGNTWVTVK